MGRAFQAYTFMSNFTDVTLKMWAYSPKIAKIGIFWYFSYKFAKYGYIPLNVF